MHLDKIIPLVTTHELAAVKAFYTEKLHFKVTFDSPEYLGLKAAGAKGAEISFMPPRTEGQPVYEGKGLCLCMQVEDVDEQYAQLKAHGLSFVQTPQDNPWGDRSFIVLDPVGTALYVFKPTEPQPKYKAHMRE